MRFATALLFRFGQAADAGGLAQALGKHGARITLSGQ